MAKLRAASRGDREIDRQRAMAANAVPPRHEAEPEPAEATWFDA